MISHVSIADARWNPDYACSCGQQRRFAYAEAPPRGENRAGPIVCRIGEIDIWIINYCIADGVIKAQDRGACVDCPCNRLCRERDDLRRVAIDERAGGEESCDIHRNFPNLPLV